MNNEIRWFRVWSVVSCLAVLSLVLIRPGVAGPSISNSSFEVDTPAPFPSYRTITDWASTGNVGVNTTAGPFWDNGTITSGTQCAFIQEVHSLTQNVPGFEAGKQYEFRIRVNARADPALRPRIQVSVAGNVVIPSTQVAQVGAVGTAGTGSPFRLLTAVFASPGSGTFALVIENVESSGDNSLLLDEIEIVPHITAATGWGQLQ
jgi:hypothetical protein